MSMERTWIEDIPVQFREKHVIGTLIKAFSKQLDELQQMFSDLIWMTDLDTAVGKNLDRVGEIVNITRQDAYQLLDPTAVTEVTDDIFRAVLKFKVLKNNTDGTYEDIMKGLHLLWDFDKAVLTYEDNPWDEDKGRKAPATIRLGINDIPSDALDPLIIVPMVIKPGGVKIVFDSSYRDATPFEWERFTRLRISVENNYFYDGAEYPSAGGKLYYNGVIEYHPESYNYNYFNGEYQFNGQIYWGPVIKEYEVIDMDATFLKQAKQKTLRLRALGDPDGTWRIKYMVWGNGLADNGTQYTPDEEQTELKNELLRKEVSLVTHEDYDTWTYHAYIGSDELVGEYISEVALADADGMLICIKTFPKKLKTEGRQMMFKIDDTLEIA